MPSDRTAAGMAHGSNRRTVATVAVPGTAASQDVGIFMSATNGGSGLRGTVEFSRWQLR